MKITRQQLRHIVREELELAHHEVISEQLRIEATVAARVSHTDNSTNQEGSHETDKKTTK
jgi:hypothetical protein